MIQTRFFLLGLTFLSIALTACFPIEKSKPASESAEYHYIMGLSSLSEKNPTEALKEFLQAEKYDSRSPQIQAGLARAYRLKQALELSEKHFKRALELSDNDPEYNNNLGALYLDMGRFDDAIRAFQLAADNLLFSQPETAWTGIGVANTQKQDYPAAQRAYQKAMALNSQYWIAPFRLGELYYNQDRPVEALAMFSRTVEIAPDFALGHYWQGLVYMKTKEPEKAKKAFLEVVRLSPKSDTAQLAENYLQILRK
jgi:Tfp pilus assembly protein PilF